MGLFLSLLVLFFPVVWLLFWLLEPIYLRLLAVGVEPACQLVGRDFRFRVEAGSLIFRSMRAPAFEADLSAVPIYSNTVLMWSLILVTPGMRLSTRAKAFLAAASMIWATQVLFLVVKVEASLIGASHPAAGAPLLWTFFDDFFEIMGKGFFPVLIWLGLGLKYLLGYRDAKNLGPSGTPGRNDPCPCGSGLKFKRCCGR